MLGYNVHAGMRTDLAPIEVGRVWKYGFVKVPKLLSKRIVTEMRQAMDDALDTLTDHLYR
jgi:hypothetical protein